MLSSMGSATEEADHCGRAHTVLSFSCFWEDRPVTTKVPCPYGQDYLERCHPEQS